LYNLRNDPFETTDVAAETPAVVARLSQILTEQHVASPLWPIPALDGKK
jgi:hypothetical protein